jgi:hypothetical protein
MKKLIILIIAPFLFLPVSLWACGVLKQKKILRSNIKDIKLRSISSDIINFSHLSKNPSLESQLGNLLLEHGQDATISIPSTIKMSQYYPFGDGQSNAIMTMGEHFKSQGFIVYGIQEKDATGKVVRTYHFNQSLNIKDHAEEILSDNWFKVTPQGWQESFYFRFESNIKNIEQMLQDIPIRLRTMSDGRIAPNPENIRSDNPISDLKTKNLGLGYNLDPWFSDSVHGRYPDANGSKTATGGIYTWGLLDKKMTPFKHLYTCFEPRNINEENKLSVPSGAGWHHIGDAGESLFSTLATKSLPTATAITHGFSQAAYGLNQVITASWLRPKQVLVALKGQFHWYLNPHNDYVCTEIWVHPCDYKTDNHWGFNCP